MDETSDDLCVLYDACVLYPAPLRDVLVSLAVTRLFRAHWTNEIHEEWITSLLDKRLDLTREPLERTRRMMDRAVPDYLITGHKKLIGSFHLPDKDDEHILAAAIHAGAHLIITFNVKDFPRSILSAYGTETCPPDTFIARLLEDHPVEVVAALGKMRRRLINPAYSVEEFLEILRRQHLLKTADRLQAYDALL